MIIALAGNPNCGKTTLFNALTGAQQRVGNWPGVTVERKSGHFTEQKTAIEVVDLPGVYSLVMASATASIDEKIATEYVLSNQADLVINILDASNLERNLYLTQQLIEMQVPVIVVLNMLDVAKQRGINVDITALSKALGCLVLPIQAHKGIGIKALKQKIIHVVNTVPVAKPLPLFCEPLATAIKKTLPTYSRVSWLALRLLEGDTYAESLVPPAILELVAYEQQRIRLEWEEDADILIADARYTRIESMMKSCLSKSAFQKTNFTAHLDRVILNRVLGIPIFLAVMYCLFLFAINVGGAFQDFFDISSDTIFVQGFAHLLKSIGTPDWLTALLANGAGKGINTTVTFIPVIGAMFLFLAFLEDSGYMARAAFVVDRGMRALGLPGKAFVPMIVGFGCNVPAVMATRTLENKRDRILTVMMTPFMSCGARLAIYAVFTAAFFPTGGQNVVFMLYLTGIGMAMLTGLLLRKTVLKGEPAPLVLELPPYHVPHVKTLLLHAWQRLQGFLFRAGKLIIPICILIGALSALNTDGTLQIGDGNTHSLLSAVGRFFTPIFSPMGIHQDNWPATVGLVTGVLAKEVVVGTLNALYSQVGHFAAVSAAGFSFWGGLHEAVMSIPQNLSQLSHSFGNPVLAQAPVHTLSQGVYGLMYQRFDGQIGAIAYLLFILLYFPCISTTAVMLRELNRAWTFFSVMWTTGIAYSVAVSFYQIATWAHHPETSAAWISGISLLFVATIIWARLYSPQKKLKTLLPSGELV